MPPLTLNLKPSPTLSTLLVILHGGAIGILWYMPIPILLASTLTGLCGISLGITLCRHTLRITNKAIVQLWEEPANNWKLKDRSGRIYLGTLSGDVLRTTQCVLLRFNVFHSRFKLPIIIWRDALDDDSFRRLRIQMPLIARQTDG
jgi:hypothetical protein